MALIANAEAGAVERQETQKEQTNPFMQLIFAPITQQFPFSYVGGDFVFQRRGNIINIYHAENGALVQGKALEAVVYYLTTEGFI